MSTSWSFYCLQCDAEPEDFDGFNHGQDILRSIYRLREHAFAIQDQDSTNYLSVEILGCHADEELWLFLRKHEGHEIALRSEYGDIEPIEGEKESTEEPGINKKISWQSLTELERNVLIAERVFGHIIIRDSVWGPLLSIRESLTGKIPHYTTDLDSAWQIVRKINEPTDAGKYDVYASFIDHLEKIVGSNMFFDLFYCDNEGNHLTPERICRAALRALGYEVR